MRKVTLPLMLVASAALLVACEEGPKPPLKTAANVPGESAVGSGRGGNSQWMSLSGRSNGADKASPTAGSIQIDDRILKACGDLPTAHFAFDSASIQGDAADLLGALARCFVSGPLAGAKLNLVGHADPRGGVAYNIALGQQRAGSVATFLSQKGVSEQRMGTVSKGAFDAIGSDENGWALDRKVEVFLAD